MHRKRLLGIFVVMTIFGGCVAASIPFFGSLAPSSRAKANNQEHVLLVDIPEDGAEVFEYQGYKIFILDNPYRAFKIPIHYRSGYGLPDPSWERPFIQCKSFVYEDSIFSCRDFHDNEHYHSIAQWDENGVATENSWMPDLLEAEFVVLGDRVIFGVK